MMMVLIFNLSEETQMANLINKDGISAQVKRGAMCKSTPSLKVARMVNLLLVVAKAPEGDYLYEATGETQSTYGGRDCWAQLGEIADGKHRRFLTIKYGEARKETFQGKLVLPGNAQNDAESIWQKVELAIEQLNQINWIENRLSGKRPNKESPPVAPPAPKPSPTFHWPTASERATSPPTVRMQIPVEESSDVKASATPSSEPAKIEATPTIAQAKIPPAPRPVEVQAEAVEQAQVSKAFRLARKLIALRNEFTARLKDAVFDADHYGELAALTLEIRTKQNGSRNKRDAKSRKEFEQIVFWSRNLHRQSCKDREVIERTIHSMNATLQQQSRYLPKTEREMFLLEANFSQSTIEGSH